MQPHGGKSVTPKENSYNYNYSLQADMVCFILTDIDMHQQIPFIKLVDVTKYKYFSSSKSCCENFFQPQKSMLFETVLCKRCLYT